MGGCRCTYKNCQNTTKTTDNVHFFHYPIKYKERCAVWIKNAEKPEFLMLEEDQLRNKVICEVHFEDKWFPNSQKKRLLQGAIPTLDGDLWEHHLPKKEEPDLPVYSSSSQLSDIQLLPANDDGTIFVLDTDSMFSSSQKVESYTYKNGMLLPSNSRSIKPEFKKYTFPRPSSSSEKSNNLELKQAYKRPKQDPDEPTVDSNCIKSEAPELEELGDESYEPQAKLLRFDLASKQVASQPESSVNSNAESQENHINHNYMMKIEQHSREIAHIKKVLKQKAFDTKIDTKTALQVLKNDLPPTLFTVLNLCLNIKCELTDDDIEFFTTVHKISPEAYQLFVDKYKWNLPFVDIVESMDE